MVSTCTHFGASVPTTEDHGVSLSVTAQMTTYRNDWRSLRAMLHGASLEIKFWPYAFHHYLRIKNAIPSKDQTTSPRQ